MWYINDTERRDPLTTEGLGPPVLDVDPGAAAVGGVGLHAVTHHLGVSVPGTGVEHAVVEVGSGVQGGVAGGQRASGRRQGAAVVGFLEYGLFGGRAVGAVAALAAVVADHAWYGHLVREYNYNQ